MARAIIAVQAKKKTIWYEKWRLLSESSIFISITRKSLLFSDCAEIKFAAKKRMMKKGLIHFSRITLFQIYDYINVFKDRNRDIYIVYVIGRLQ